MQQTYYVRWMIHRDMDAVSQIEQESFDTPWGADEFLKCLRQRNVIGMVCQVGDEVVGFMLYELFKNHLHVMNFAVSPKFRRQKVGTALVDKLVSKLSSHRRTRISLAVRESNLAAQLFFKSRGFVATKVFRRYYEDTNESAYQMEHRLAESGVQPSDDNIKPVNRVFGDKEAA